MNRTHVSMSDEHKQFVLSCPVPLGNYATVQLAHGGGGRLMRGLIESLFLPIFQRYGVAGPPAPPHDSAVLPVEQGRIALTTDSFVVSPLEFPGGDIGKLAVFGTVNDLAVAGAQPNWLSAAFLIEEGFPLDRLRRIAESMAAAAQEAGVQIVAGDTKVVDHGKGDGLYITTTGVGMIPPGIEISPARVRPGDAVIVSGDLGRHGIAVMSVREGLNFQTALESDCASLAALVGAMLTVGSDIHCLRDLTRGGLAAALNEIAAHAQVGIRLAETAIPISQAVASACELLGLDPLYVANEGRLIAIVPATAAEAVLTIMRNHPDGRGAAIIGEVIEDNPGLVELRSRLGGSRILELLSGEQMPRIC